MTGKKFFVIMALAAASIPLISYILVFGTTGKADQILAAMLGSYVQIAWAAAPFLIAAFVWPDMKRGKLAGILAFLITLIPWGNLTYGGWMTQSGHNMGGADIGTGLILMVLPFLLTPFIRLVGGAPALHNPS
jgi:hypothetical protein